MEIVMINQIHLPLQDLRLQEEFAGMVARAVVEPGRDIESLRGMMGESMRQVDGLFESLLSQSVG
jgi:hypothetical protein